MPGPLPRPDADRVRTAPPAYSWTDLPVSGRKGAAPKLPSGRKWHAATGAAWRHWWSTPQATRWDPSGLSLHRWALLYDALQLGGQSPAPIHAALQAIEDRHGFSPAAMAKLRWRILEPEAPPVAPSSRRSDRRARVIEMVPRG